MKNAHLLAVLAVSAVGTVPAHAQLSSARPVPASSLAAAPTAGDFDEGCANSTGAGSKLGVETAAFPSVSNDDLTLVATQLPNQPGIFFQGDRQLASEPLFGAGIRCCGENVVRWITVMAEGGCASSDPANGCGVQIGGVGGSIAALAGLSAGDTRCYQFWYRDPSGSPCPGTSFNLSPGVVLTWGP